MVSVSLILTLTTLIIMVVSNTLICNEPNCEFEVCSSNNACINRTYICTSNTTTCTLQCEHCTNITLISSSRNTQLSCNQNNSCHHITIHIQTQQIDSKPATNTLLLTCSHPSSCSHINISCDNPNICQCEDYDNAQCSNIYYNNDRENGIQTQPNNQFIFDEHGTAVILIIFVVLFWCLVCFCVPFYIKQWRQKMLLKDPMDVLPNVNADDLKDANAKMVEIIQIKEAVAISIGIQSAAATHRKVLSNSMMARIVNNMHLVRKSESDDSDNAAANDGHNPIIMVQNAEEILKCIHTHNNNGELQLMYDTNNEAAESPHSHNANSSPVSAQSVVSEMLTVATELDSLNSNKAQQLSRSQTVASDFSCGGLKLPKLETSTGSAATRTYASSELKLGGIQISMMSPSNMSPPTNIGHGSIDALSCFGCGEYELELLCTESQANEKLNGDYVD